MQNTNTTAEKLAAYLLEIEAVKLSINPPFTWVSGIKSPIYCDNRRILSFPEVRDYVRDELALVVSQHFADAEVIAGVATGAIAHGVLVAQKLNLPFVYVRSSAKGHGLQNLIEGNLPKGKKVAVVEDLISTGQSSLAAIDALINAEAEVLGMVSIFTYQLKTAIQNMEAAKCKLFPLCDYNTLVSTAISKGILHHSNLDSLEKWKENPQEWRP